VSLFDTIGDTIGEAWGAAREGGIDWVENKVSEWGSNAGERPDRPETVNQEESPAQYVGDGAVAQRQAERIANQMEGMKKWAMLGLGAAALYLIVNGVNR